MPQDFPKAFNQKNTTFTPLLHTLSVLGVICLIGAGHIYKIYRDGRHVQSLFYVLAEIAGAGFGCFVAGALVCVVLGKSKSYSLFYTVSYLAAIASISSWAFR